MACTPWVMVRPSADQWPQTTFRSRSTRPGTSNQGYNPCSWVPGVPLSSMPMRPRGVHRTGSVPSSACRRTCCGTACGSRHRATAPRLRPHVSRPSAWSTSAPARRAPSSSPVRGPRAPASAGAASPAVHRGPRPARCAAGPG
ncbi:hypothetical protein G6F50_016354 [Rhizopus delemar]|uniref:Uncharacterized protein n=1 Tax=Rhizopus delemar TaxID=936053 RepID=A0A9P6XTW3_9FUNG|nr:hypothetical protein G6F50_016354 [Rhizopus delemar]